MAVKEGQVPMPIPRLVTALIVVSALAGPAEGQRGESPSYQPLLDTLQQAVLSADHQVFFSLLSPEANRDAFTTFVEEALREAVDRVTLTPRFQLPLDDMPSDSGYDLTVEVFFESGARGRLETWQFEIVRAAETGRWTIRNQALIDSLGGLHHLTLNTTTQYAADNSVVLGEDLSLTLIEGSAFVTETEAGVTGLVLLGDGVMNFSPQPEAERGQVRIFSGDEVLEAEFDAAFIRVHPEVFASRVSTSGLVERPVDAGDLRRATEVFNEFIQLSFMLDLSHISDRVWSFTPAVGDFLAEIRSKRHGTLTYAQSGNQPEDISLSDRVAGHVISLYPSARKRATQGRYFADDDQVALDILDYDISTSFQPLGITQEELRATPELVGCRIVGTTRLALRVSGFPITSFSLRLADELAVSSVTSSEFGPLLFFRMKGQNSLIVNLPAEVPGGTTLTVTVQYAGDLRAQELDENWIATRYFWFDAQALYGLGEPRYIYSNRSYWYPQGLVSDYATATLNLSVPSGWGVVASGSPLDNNPPISGASGTDMQRFSFVALQPARYLSALISRFDDRRPPVRQVHVAGEAQRPVTPKPLGSVYYDTLTVDSVATPRGAEEVESIADQAADIASFYASLIGDVPYPSMTVALTDSPLPGGHSPAYSTIMNHPLPRAPGVIVSWQTDPVSFSGYPEFFLAHEVAHQWWGQAVGWKNYHEQWLSEGLAQYFAALHAEQSAGPEVFADILRQMRRWAMRHSDKGPIYLGYRLGHLKNQPRVFRALVYNKGAMVMHMLRGLIGDEAFFAGLRRFYHEWRFEKAGTDALQLAFEIEAGQPLDRFFERWIHEAGLPELEFSSRTETDPSGDHIVLRFEQRTERIFDLPVTVDLTYRSGHEDKIVVPVNARVTEVRIPSEGDLRRVRVNRDYVALAEIDE